MAEPDPVSGNNARSKGKQRPMSSKPRKDGNKVKDASKKAAADEMDDEAFEEDFVADEEEDEEAAREARK